MLLTQKQDEWDKFIFSLDLSNDGSIYKLNKKLLHKSPATYPLKGPNGLVFSAHDRAELFTDTYQRQFLPNQGPILPKSIIA